MLSAKLSACPLYIGFTFFPVRAEALLAREGLEEKSASYVAAANNGP